MIFAFLYGLSMDYEVFMLTRMREAHDDGDSTPDAIRHGLARTGKLVTSAALVLAMAFFVLSTSPGTDIKQFGIGLAAGVIFDATVIRALLVPSLMMLMGKWNWWMPKSVGKLLFVRGDVRRDAARVRLDLEDERLGCLLRNVDQRLHEEERAHRDDDRQRDADLQRHLARRRSPRRHELQLDGRAEVHRANDTEVVVERHERRDDADDHQPDPVALVRRRET